VRPDQDDALAHSVEEIAKQAIFVIGQALFKSRVSSSSHRSQSALSGFGQFLGFAEICFAG
jgi:hypothetical protein